MRSTQGARNSSYFTQAAAQDQNRSLPLMTSHTEQKQIPYSKYKHSLAATMSSSTASSTLIQECEQAYRAQQRTQYPQQFTIRKAKFEQEVSGRNCLNPLSEQEDL